MAQSVQTPLPLYLGLDGQRLQDGYLFFGVVDLNPETSPITMYWDAALTQPAAQPIRTINGMPSRSGTPAMLYTNTDHSLTIKDSLGRLVLYARNSLEYSLEAQLANSASGSLGAGKVGYNSALVYAANTVGFALNQRKAVFATGVAATDDANVQAAIDAAPVGGVIDLFGAFASNAAKNLKPQVMLRNGGAARFNHSNTNTNCFQYVPGGSLGFPGQIKILDIEFYGPGEPGSGEALGTLTWSNVKAAVLIDANAPNCAILGTDIRGFFAGVVLRNAYCSFVGGQVFDCRHGIMIFGESHNTYLVNPFVESCTLTGLSVNYGAGQVINQGTVTLEGAYQNTQVGIWLEGCQGFYGAGTIYFEGNSISDMVIGVGDAGVYARSANFTKIDSVGTSSPVASPSIAPLRVRPQGRNIQVNHSVDVRIGGFGAYSGAPTTTPNISVDGFCDRTHIGISFINNSTPYDLDDPSRVVVERAGTVNYAENRLNTTTFGPHGAATPLARGPLFTSIGTPSGRLSMVLEALADATDVVVRVKSGQGLFRVTDLTAANEYFNVDAVNGRINSLRPHVMRVYTVATLPAPSSSIPPGSRATVSDANATTFNSIVAGGGANTVPVFVDGAGNWRIG